MDPYEPIWVGAQSGLGPIWAQKGKILLKKQLISIKNHKIVNKNIKGVKYEKLFLNKDVVLR